MLEGVGHDRQREDRRVGAASGQGGEKEHSPWHSVVAYQALRKVEVNQFIVPCAQNCVRSEEYLPLYWRVEAKVEGVSVERAFIPSRSGLAATISTRVKTASLGKEINIPWLLTLKECCWRFDTRRDLNLCILYFTQPLCHR